MPRESNAPRKRRLHLELTEEAFDILQELSKATGKNKAEVLRTGLALYGISFDESQNGRSLGVIEGDKIVKEIVTT